jgi:hypothetical protein
LILSLRPDVTFSSTSTLTSAYLSTVNTMVIGDGFDVSHTVAALSAAEADTISDWLPRSRRLSAPETRRRRAAVLVQRAAG